MNKKKLLMILCILIVTWRINAQQQVSEKEARNAAINTLYNKAEILNISPDTEIDFVHSFSNNRNCTLMYEVIFKNRAAILLSGSKACLPVLGYYIKPKHDNGAVFDTANINVPCCLQDFFYDYIQQIEWCFEQEYIELYYEEQWNEFQKPYLPKSLRATIIVAPLLTTKWGQSKSNDDECDASYNYYAPTSQGCDCGRCAAGCVAVAIGQIMKYWNYPVYRVFNMDKQFDWCNMPDELFSSSPHYEKERDAVARLLKACGNQSGMNYCNSGCSSSAIDMNAHSAITGFGYSSDADLQRRFFWSDNVWKGRVKNNLNNSQPVYYSGSSGIFSGGHAFVCDGYNSDDEFHFNWGWNGKYHNNWFTLNDLTPYNHNYNSGQQAIFYIYPNNNDNYCDFSLPLEVHYNLWYNTSLFYIYNPPPPHENVPKTFTVLESVQSGQGHPTSWHTVEAGQSSEYVAHKTIRLLPGFHAKAGSNFSARIEPCIDCESRSNPTSPYFTTNKQINEDIYTNTYETTPSPEKYQQHPVKNKEINIYPNPNDGTFTITTNFNPQEIISIKVFNILGQFVYQQEGFQNNTIQMLHSAKGMYWIEVTSTTQNFIKKIIVQ